MKSVVVTGAGTTEVLNVERPIVGPADALLAVKACGICGSDSFYMHIGGVPPRQGNTPLGHEIAGEIVEVGPEVTGLAVGDHVVVNPMASPTGIIGNGGARGGLAEFLLIEQAVVGESVAIIPDHVPWHVAALNEPMAVARHAVNRANPVAGEKAVVFGAGPIGLGALIDLTLRGIDTVVIDVQPTRLAKALAIGASAAIDSSKEDVAARLIELHGDSPLRPGESRPSTDIYIDAAGVPAVITSVQRFAKHGARLSIPAVHKSPVEVDFGALLSTELTITLSRGYPTEIFEVTYDIVAAWDRYAQIVSDMVPFTEVQEALTLAGTPGAADKVVVTF
ncbi:alcohol dehydrogenase catalytic domain-containing protein [Pseudarthrobacter equi]|uniref:zinc-dependent alcohol dehydrogenase n=1 Tax=Pseudarthrobacter equi TaxID=728066 RepID=UPI0028D3A04E|nr:alcohol dehydrogenase catalytic domain-containing protein [Pseudarthrobacter equi]